ncbi:putative acyl-activating enzyme 19 [Vitis vinifera]|uniref:Putative acyl-activating enzyme 19 n=1 Tax=Vitis vinifera TaxID=29760 RepID=A0A438H5E1_VITVI|nr:putative acyl-activating enzyme 19 [Vitis vinifera]
MHRGLDAFCDALSVEKVCNDDDFFMMGGDSIAAAYVSYNLGINMRLIYNFPSPSKLQVALLKKEGSSSIDVGIDDIGSLKSDTCDLYSSKPCGTSSKPVFENNDKYPVTSKCLKVDSNTYATSKSVIPCDGCPWNSNSVPMLSIVVFKDWDIYLLIGSHSHKFVCVNAKRDNLWCTYYQKTRHTRGDAGNFMENHEHRVKNGVAMESSRGRMGSTLVFCMTS